MQERRSTWSEVKGDINLTKDMKIDEKAKRVFVDGDTIWGVNDKRKTPGKGHRLVEAQNKIIKFKEWKPIDDGAMYERYKLMGWSRHFENDDFQNYGSGVRGMKRGIDLTLKNGKTIFFNLDGFKPPYKKMKETWEQRKARKGTSKQGKSWKATSTEFKHLLKVAFHNPKLLEDGKIRFIDNSKILDPLKIMNLTPVKWQDRQQKKKYVGAYQGTKRGD